MRLTRRQALRQLALGGAVLAVGALTACDLAPPPPTPRSLPTAKPRAEPTPPPPTQPPDVSSIARIVLEGEDFTPVGPGWQALTVGRGNYMVDTIGASHISGGALLHAPADAIGARAVLDTTVQRAGQYRLLSRYEYPFRDYHVRVGITIEQPDRPPARLEIGAPDATRSWFLGVNDAPWHDFPTGTEGLATESSLLDLVAGPAHLTLEVLDGPAPAADRNLDLLLFTTDIDETYKARGTRAYPILDEIGLAGAGRVFMRITNPSDSGESMNLEARYTINRVPWMLPSLVIDKTGVSRSTGRPQRLEPGERTPWFDISCRDTTHSGHLQLNQVNNSQNRRATLLVELASGPDDTAIFKTIEYREESGSRLLLNLPPYPARTPKQIETGEETLQRIVGALQASPAPVGQPPLRTLIYGGLGDDAERNLISGAKIYQLYRRLFVLLGLNAFNRLAVGALPAEAQLLRDEGRQTGRFQMIGDYRWYPSDENIAKARRDLDTVQGQPYLRGFSFGDEINLKQWTPKDGHDDGLRATLQERGLAPEDVLPPDEAAEVAGQPDEQRWQKVRFVEDPDEARKAPRLYVESRRYLVRTALDRLAAQSAKLREAFGDDIIYGPNYSPHPFFWPEEALFVQAFRRGAINRAGHSDYWWQVGELGPQMTGFILDTFRCGLHDRQGVIQTYAMPHSPGTTDADFRRGVMTLIAHGAKALDYFQVAPEQANNENYILHDDLSRFLTVRDVTYEIGAVDGLIADGRQRGASVALLISESTDAWDRITLGVAPGLQATDPDDFPSIAYNLERKCVWSALRHAQIPIDIVVEDDLIDGTLGRYRVLYVAADRMARAAATKLASWVRDGGVLISMAGGGFLDEFGEPLDTLQPVYGLTSQQLEKETTFIRPRIELPRLRPLDMLTASLSGESVPVPALAFRQRLDPMASVEVLARFGDGSVAATNNRFGRGQAILWGTLLGAAYVQSGFPDPLPPPDRGPFTHTPLSGFRPELRRLLVDPALSSTRRVVECSEPLVETGLLETERALLVPLACLLDGPRQVDLLIFETGPVSAVRSVRRGPLPFRQDGNDVRTSLTLDPTDFVVVER